MQEAQCNFYQISPQKQRRQLVWMVCWRAAPERRWPSVWMGARLRRPLPMCTRP